MRPTSGSIINKYCSHCYIIVLDLSAEFSISQWLDSKSGLNLLILFWPKLSVRKLKQSSDRNKYLKRLCLRKFIYGSIKPNDRVLKIIFYLVLYGRNDYLLLFWACNQFNVTLDINKLNLTPNCWNWFFYLFFTRNKPISALLNTKLLENPFFIDLDYNPIRIQTTIKIKTIFETFWKIIQQNKEKQINF